MKLKKASDCRKFQILKRVFAFFHLIKVINTSVKKSYRSQAQIDKLKKISIEDHLLMDFKHNVPFVPPKPKELVKAILISEFQSLETRGT